MEMSANGQYEPRVPADYQDPGSGYDLGAVCPFYSTEDEDRIADRLYSTVPNKDVRVGAYRNLYAGAVEEGAVRQNSSSGGLVTWILSTLLSRGLINGVIHVGATDRATASAPLFAYSISVDLAAVESRAKSRYYPVEFSQVMQFVRDKPGRYAFVGVPCFVKAVRLLAAQDAAVAKAVKYCIALFCGHMKSAAFADSIGWQLGVPPGAIKSIDFRKKRPNAPASRYGVKVEGFDGVVREAVASDLYGSDWGLGFFKPKACDYCDDIAGETADVACGDAWLPAYVNDHRGTNVVVVRDGDIDALLTEGARTGALKLDAVGPADIYQSQAGNYRHRREGLAYRLWLADRRGEWHPPKRVSATDDHLTEKRKSIYRQREELAAKSHEAFIDAVATGSFAAFKKTMNPLIHRYYRASGLYARYKIKNILRSLRKLIGAAK